MNLDMTEHDNAWCFSCVRAACADVEAEYLFCPLCKKTKLVFIQNWDLLDISILALRLHQGGLANASVTAMTEFALKLNARLPEKADQAQIGQYGDWNYWVSYYLQMARKDKNVKQLLEMVWFQGAFLTLGDRFDQARYLDHLPEYELVYHLRNGIAHGNKFNFKKPGLERLEKYGAHNRNIEGEHRLLDIQPNLQGLPVLFDFASSSELLSLINGIHMKTNTIILETDPWRHVNANSEGYRLAEQ